MALADEDGPARATVHGIGQDLSSLSLDELAERIAALKAEILRVEETIRAKQASAVAADTFFKRQE